MADGKTRAAKAALEFVKDGMGVGLGSGSTAAEFIRLLGARAKARKWKLACVPTSEDSRVLALKAGLSTCALDEVKSLGLAVDGADAVDPNLNLVKGGGGCHAREKVVAYAAKKFVCIVDESKLRKSLDGFPVPVEVLPFAGAHVARAIERDWDAKAEFRRGGGKLGPVVTDNGNYILDATFRRVGDPRELERDLQCLPGVVASGIFAARRPILIIGRKDKAEMRA
ncbi:MAG: ribose-5-phosphate isomerase RpiA [Candidatus ainarchaeum sp.]|nr:ribose-5-phosphate isomerase RpiA [Candidatus ainarchaeum sp.]